MVDDIKSMDYFTLRQYVETENLSSDAELKALNRLTKIQQYCSWDEIIQAGMQLKLKDKKKTMYKTNEEMRQKRKEEKRLQDEIRETEKKKNEFKKKRDDTNRLIKQFKEARKNNSVPEDLIPIFKEKLKDYNLGDYQDVIDYPHEELHQIVLRISELSDKYHAKYVSYLKKLDKLYTQKKLLNTILDPKHD